MSVAAAERPRPVDPWRAIRHARNVCIGAAMIDGRRVSGALAKHVLLAIASYADPDGTNANPSMARLAADCERDERTVRLAVRALERAGLIRVDRGGDPTGRTNSYAVILPRLRAVPAPTGGSSAPRVGAAGPPTWVPVPGTPPTPPAEAAAGTGANGEKDALRAAPPGRPARRPGCAKHRRAKSWCRDCRPTSGPAYERYQPPPPAPVASAAAIEATRAALRAALAGRSRNPGDDGAGGRAGGEGSPPSADGRGGRSDGRTPAGDGAGGSA